MNELFLTKSNGMRVYGIILTALLLLFAPGSKAIAPAGLPVKQRTDLTTITPKQIEKLTGKKLTFFEKVKLRLLQKALKKYKNADITEQQKKQANISMILGISSIVLLLISSVALLGFLGILSIPAAILALVFGIKSLNGNSNTKGIIGVVTGGVTIGLFLIALILILVFFSGFTFE